MAAQPSLPKTGLHGAAPQPHWDDLASPKLFLQPCRAVCCYAVCVQDVSVQRLKLGLMAQPSCTDTSGICHES